MPRNHAALEFACRETMLLPSLNSKAAVVMSELVYYHAINKTKHKETNMNTA